MRAEEFPAFLYVLENPREPGNIRYIGATMSPRGRFQTHRFDARKKSQALYVWWNQLREQGIEPVMRKLWQGPVSELWEKEIKAIAGYRRLGFELLNETSGGLSISDKARRKGHKVSPETRALLSKIHSGRPKTEAHNAAVSVAKMGKYPEHFRKSNEARKAANAGKE